MTKEEFSRTWKRTNQRLGWTGLTLFLAWIAFLTLGNKNEFVHNHLAWCFGIVSALCVVLMLYFARRADKAVACPKCSRSLMHRIAATAVVVTQTCPFCGARIVEETNEAIGIGSPIAEAPSLDTVRTDRVYGDSADVDNNLSK